MLKLWPNWFELPSRTPDEGITHLNRRSKRAKVHITPKDPSEASRESESGSDAPGHGLRSSPCISGGEEPLAFLLLLPINMHDLLIKSYSRLGACKKLTSKLWKGGNGKCWREMSH